MNIFAIIYRLLGWNSVKGRRGLQLDCSGVFCKKCMIVNHGSNNKVIIEKGCRFQNCRIEIFGNNNTVYVKNDCVGHEIDIWISDAGTIEIGEHTHFAGKIHLACTEGKKITIGNRCLFASEIVLRNGDSHSIIDLEGNRLNYAKDICIEDHVWMGQAVTVLKGTIVGSDCVIGSNSLLTGKIFPFNCVIGGNPAKVLKTDVSWHHELK